MATTTTNFGLRKPAATDTVSVVTDIADNMDLLDDHRHTGTTDGLQIQTAGLVDDAVTAAKIADDVVGAAHLATMVPALLGRQGGSATDWSVAGTTDYTSGINVRMQCGVATVSVAGDIFGFVTVTFPVAFSDKPVVVATPSNRDYVLAVNTVTATNFIATMIHHEDTITIATVYVNWLALGPE